MKRGHFIDEALVVANDEARVSATTKREARPTNEETLEANEKAAKLAGAANLRPQHGIDAVLFARLRFILGLTFRIWACPTTCWLYVNIVAHI